jgi:phage terminase small subunit
VKPKCPPRLDAAGRALWRRFVERFEFDPHELAVLESACRQADDVATLEALIADDGMTVPGSAGQPRLHPAVAEARNGRLALGKLLAQLRLPEDAQPIRSEASTRAQRAAEVRWAAERKRADGAAS